MKRVLIVVVALVPFYAQAGKMEREYMKNEVMPAVKSAEEAYKKACGCGLKISIDDKSINEERGMSEAKHIAEGITNGVSGYCTDAESKKAVCKMKTLKIAKTSTTEFKWDGKSGGTATTDGSSFTSFEMMTQQLDK